MKIYKYNNPNITQAEAEQKLKEMRGVEDGAME